MMAAWTLDRMGETKIADAALESLKNHKRSDDRLYQFVPASYTNTMSSGLVVFLYGGARRSPRTNPAMYLNFGKGEAAGDMFQDLRLIAVGPSAPWNPKTIGAGVCPAIQSVAASGHGRWEETGQGHGQRENARD